MIPQLLLLAAALGIADRPVFVDVTREAGLSDFRNIQGGPEKTHIVEVMGGGAAFLDYDRDGNLDILLISGTPERRLARGGPVCALYRGDGKGKFHDVTAKSGLAVNGWGMGVAVADYDNDGWDDIYITGYHRNFLFRNTGNGTFEDKTEAAGVALVGGWSLGAAFGDIDRDGDLDLYVTNYLFYPFENAPKRDESCNYRGFQVFCGPRGLPGLRDSLFINDGKGHFRDAAPELGIDPDKLYGLGVVIADYDNDGWPDIFVANDLTANLLYRSKGGGKFEEVAIAAGAAFSEDGVEEGSMGVDFGDLDNDGWLDLYYTNSSYQSNTMLANNKDGGFTNITNSAGHGESTWLFVGWGTAFADLDNDGREDLIVANGHLYPEADRFEMGLKYRQRRLLFWNEGGAKFREAGLKAGLTAEDNSRGLAVGDFDNDGDLDVLINNLDGPPTLMRNEAAGARNWLEVRCVGFCVGARFTARTPDGAQMREIKSGTSYLSHNDTRVHFGLGPRSVVERLEVRWPSGRTSARTDVKAGQILLVEEDRQR